MNQKLDSYYQILEKAVSTQKYEKALSFIVDNKETFMGSYDIKRLMGIIKQIPDECFVTALQKLIRAWVAFLCGENFILAQFFSEIHESQLQTAVESSLFYSLKALTTFMNNQTNGLKYAKLSVDILDADPENSFYYANAKLTYGQLLSSTCQNKKATHEFYTAYHLFKQCRSFFPAVVSLINYGLKKHALGEVADVIETFRIELTAYGSVEEGNPFFELLKLPLGIAFFELNKQSLAADYMESVRRVLYSSDFIHMFGVLEMHLVYSYAILGDYKKAHDLIHNLAEKVGKLHYEKINNLCAALRVDLCLLEGRAIDASDREAIELDYLLNGSKASIGTLLSLARLKLRGLSEGIKLEDLLSGLEMLLSAGNIPLIQSCSIVLAELYYQAGDTKSCKDFLLKAVGIYKEHRMSGRFLIEKAECLWLIKDLDMDLYKQLSLKVQKEQCSDLLTERELEILDLISQGLSNEEISTRLYIGIGTTKWHINNIFSKLSVKRRVQAVAEAKKLGLIKA